MNKMFCALHQFHPFQLKKQIKKIFLDSVSMLFWETDPSFKLKDFFVRTRYVNWKILYLAKFIIHL
jgi:hypothetical protein